MTTRKRALYFSALLICGLAGSLLLPKKITAAAIAVGSTAPAFELKNVDGSMVSLASSVGEVGTLVIFTCNHCPFAMAYEDRLIALANQFQSQGIKFVAISSNDPKIKPEDGYEAMQKRAKDKSLPYPYLINEEGDIAMAYGAARTPEVFLLDKSQKVVYTGRIDDNTEAKDVKVHDLENALTKLVEGKPGEIDPKSTAAFGCTIKFRK
ncbi:MAG: thioredoxin family protein [Calditrichaeota bacterium]|nr:thioredoxin family protein [Calditrichota bacterium]MCB9391764.1 thioredoxin family protein [Calditrichota bacterium]